jgi:hypothetical protein
MGRVETLAKRPGGQANVADDHCGAGHLRQYRDLGGAGRQGAITSDRRSRSTLEWFHAEAQRAQSLTKAISSQVCLSAISAPLREPKIT